MHINTMITILTYILHIYYIYVERVRSKVSREEEDTVFQKKSSEDGSSPTSGLFIILHIYLYI